jgi:hypothetical protein
MHIHKYLHMNVHMNVHMHMHRPYAHTQTQATGHRTQATGHRPQDTGHRPHATDAVEGLYGCGDSWCRPATLLKEHLLATTMPAVALARPLVKERVARSQAQTPPKAWTTVAGDASEVALVGEGDASDGLGTSVGEGEGDPVKGTDAVEGLDDCGGSW